MARRKKKDTKWVSSIVEVLKTADAPMHYTDIVDEILKGDFRGKIGATPSHTVNSILNRDVKNGNDSLFVKIGKGVFALRGQQSPQQIKAKIESEEDLSEEEDEEVSEEVSNGVIKAFGMYWRRDYIEWSGAPKIFGAEKEGAKLVDFCNQQGVYILYDGSKPVYVGRTTDRPLGRRLNEHTKDRHNGRWNRFSWFGMLDINEDGALVPGKSLYSVDQCIIAFEAILIEGMEPPQNRKRGDDFIAVEFMQILDPQLEKNEFRKKVEAFLHRS